MFKSFLFPAFAQGRRAPRLLLRNMLRGACDGGVGCVAGYIPAPRRTAMALVFAVLFSSRIIVRDVLRCTAFKRLYFSGGYVLKKGGT